MRMRGLALQREAAFIAKKKSLNSCSCTFVSYSIGIDIVSGCFNMIALSAAGDIVLKK